MKKIYTKILLKNSLQNKYFTLKFSYVILLLEIITFKLNKN